MSSDSGVRIDKQLVSSLELRNRHFRLDPSNYAEEVESIRRHLKTLGVETPTISGLQGFKEVTLPNRFTRVFMENSAYGVPMIGTSSMLMARLPDNARIQISSSKGKHQLLVRKGDILLSRSGSVGSVILCGNSYTTFAASDDCLRLRFTWEVAGFVTAYLESQIGRVLLTRDGHGKVIRHLKERDIKNLRIPAVNPVMLARINNLRTKAAEVLDEARTAIETAETIIKQSFTFLGRSVKREKWLNIESGSFVTGIALTTENRLDPHYLEPRAASLREWGSKVEGEKLGQIADVWGVSRFKRHRADKGHGTPLYSSADIMRARISPSAHLSASRNETPVRRCIVQEGDILVCCSGALGGIVGRAVIAGKALSGQAVSQHALRVRVTNPKYEAEYVAAVLSSRQYGYPLMTSLRHGKDVPEIDSARLKRIPIPLLSSELQHKIAASMRVFKNKLDEYNNLFEKAQSVLALELEWKDPD